MNHTSGNSLHQPGDLLNNRYRIIRQLEKGGFGQPYVAEDNNDNNCECVVKQLHLTFSNPQVLEQARNKFKKEAKILEQLGDHEQIPKFIEFFEENQEFYLVQQFIDGQDLEQEIMPSQPWRETQVISLLQDVLEILLFIHKHKIIHRDIKPSNLIRREKDEKIILIDFGSIKEITTLSLDRQGRFFTQPVGTKDYMAPEQWDGKPKFSSDIYALGITAIEALIGSCPQEHELTEKYTWRNRAKVSPKLAKILNKMVQKDLRERYQSASEVLADLKQKPGITWLVWVSLGTVTILILIIIGYIFPIVRALSVYKEANELVKLNQYKEAIERYTGAIQLMPKFPEALTNRGYAFIKLQKYQLGFKDCDDATKISPNDSLSWNCKGSALEKLNNNKEALIALERAIKLDPSFADPWYNKGEILLEEKQPEQALVALNEAIRLNPNFLFAWNAKGKALHQQMKYQDAANAFREAIKINNNYYYAWIGLGNALRQLDQRDLEALDAYDMAIKIDPSIFDGWFAKGAVLESLKRSQEALVAYEKAAEIRPDYEPLKEIIQRLK